jgi:hypothetical protein
MTRQRIYGKSSLPMKNVRTAFPGSKELAIQDDDILADSLNGNFAPWGSDASGLEDVVFDNEYTGNLTAHWYGYKDYNIHYIQNWELKCRWDGGREINSNCFSQIQTHQIVDSSRFRGIYEKSNGFVTIHKGFCSFQLPRLYIQYDGERIEDCKKIMVRVADPNKPIVKWEKMDEADPFISREFAPQEEFGITGHAFLNSAIRFCIPLHTMVLHPELYQPKELRFNEAGFRWCEHLDPRKWRLFYTGEDYPRWLRELFYEREPYG